MGGEIKLPQSVIEAAKKVGGGEGAGVEGGDIGSADAGEISVVDVLSEADREAAILAADKAEKAAKITELNAKRAEEADRASEIAAAEAAFDDDGVDADNGGGFGSAGVYSALGGSGGVQPGQAGFGQAQSHRVRGGASSGGNMGRKAKKSGFFRKLFGRDSRV